MYRRICSEFFILLKQLKYFHIPTGRLLLIRNKLCFTQHDIFLMILKSVLCEDPLYVRLCEVFKLEIFELIIPRSSVDLSCDSQSSPKS